MKMGIVEDELKDVKKHCESQIQGSKIIACVSSMVQISIVKTQYKQLIACIQFPDDYPHVALLFELKSKTLSNKFLLYLTNMCEKECKENIGKPQVLRLLQFIKVFLEENPLCICSEELNSVKQILENGDKMSLRQKLSSVSLHITHGQYFLTLNVSVPDNYPEKRVEIYIKDCSYPSNFKRWFNGQANEIARQCVEKSLKQKPKDAPFQPKPSFEPVVKFLIEEVKRYPLEPCQLCKTKCFPDDPKEIITVEENDASHIERVYCGHIFHKGCLDQFMTTPPFSGGKKCPECNKIIYHEKWKTSHKLAEDRWSHQEAKKREIGEVVEFFG